MEIKKQLLFDHSKSNTEEIVFYVADNPERLNELMDIFLGVDPLLKQRAAWVIGDLGRTQPTLLKPFDSALIEHLKLPELHDAVKRNTIRYLSETQLNEELWGEAFDLAYKTLSSKTEKVAIKVFSMVLALNIVKKIPELKDELKFAIEEQMPFGTPGFKNRGAKTLVALEKI